MIDLTKEAPEGLRPLKFLYPKTMIDLMLGVDKVLNLNKKLEDPARNCKNWIFMPICLNLRLSNDMLAPEENQATSQKSLGYQRTVLLRQENKIFTIFLSDLHNNPDKLLNKKGLLIFLEITSVK